MRLKDFFNRDMKLMCLIGVVMFLMWFVPALYATHIETNFNDLCLALQNKKTDNSRANRAAKIIIDMAEKNNITPKSLKQLEELGYSIFFVQEGEFLIKMARGGSIKKIEYLAEWKNLGLMAAGFFWIMMSVSMTAARAMPPTNKKGPLDLPWRKFWLYPFLFVMLPVFSLYCVAVKISLFFKNNRRSESH